MHLLSAVVMLASPPLLVVAAFWPPAPWNLLLVGMALAALTFAWNEQNR